MPRILLGFLRLLMWAAICVACVALVGAVAGHMWPWAAFDLLGHRVVLMPGHVSVDPWFVTFELPFATGRNTRFRCGPLNVWWMAIGAAFVAIVLRRLSRPHSAPGHCICGYDLTRNVSGRCPECGTPATATESEGKRPLEDGAPLPGSWSARAPQLLCSRGGILTAIIMGASIVMIMTAATVEILNARAGHPLPANGLSLNQSRFGKWRDRPWTDEQSWRATFGPRNAAGNPTTRALTAIEQFTMRTDIREARAANALRGVLRTWGLLQHLLVLLGLGLGCWIVFFERVPRWMELLAAVGVCVALVAGVLMIHRGYFDVLGW